MIYYPAVTTALSSRIFQSWRRIVYWAPLRVMLIVSTRRMCCSRWRILVLTTRPSSDLSRNGTTFSHLLLVLYLRILITPLLCAYSAIRPMTPRLITVGLLCTRPLTGGRRSTLRIQKCLRVCLCTLWRWWRGATPYSVRLSKTWSMLVLIAKTERLSPLIRSSQTLCRFVNLLKEKV